MKFSKMHGIGNDYIYVDAARERVVDPPALARAISHRNRGIGGDGLILVTPVSEGSLAHVAMRMFNADGSEAEMCGNGIRCLTKFAVDRGLAQANPLRVETRRGILETKWTRGVDGAVAEVEVDLGEPILEAGSMGVAIQGVGTAQRIVGMEWTPDMWADALSGQSTRVDPSWLANAGVAPCASVVSMGNPHIVFWARDVGRVPLELVGGAIERHRFFPERINVHFVEVITRSEVRMRTWERGSGITQACGTGASAVCVAGVLEGRLDRTVLAHLPGGDLTLRWVEKDGHVRMIGPATHVFDGEWPA
ncbi:MAG: diaminopimelate epimerase [Phycisphaerales bacterium]|nr:diaminopimelate epimerase [Phycisphaerales bacterium]